VRTSGLDGRPILLLGLLVGLHIALPRPVFAQQARPSMLAIDTSVALDETLDATAGDYSTGVIMDAVVSADLGHGFEAIVRPFVQRLGSGAWNRQIWVAALRYERSGPIGLRVDAGLIPSPIGLANLTLRPQQNPTIAQPASLFTPLPPIDVRAPRMTLLGAVYPYGGQVTVSSSRWDARAAIVDTSPLRTRRIFAEVNPPRFANVVVGGGVTPIVGLRIGASVTHGGWQRANETPFATADRDATLVTVESEFAFAYTKLAGEWVRDRIETSGGDRIASGWFVQGQQTLAPRWFAAGRVERMSSPLVFGILTQEQHLTGTEEVLGFRVTPEITVRLGHRARRGFGRPGYTHLAAVSVVWWRRWI